MDESPERFPLPINYLHTTVEFLMNRIQGGESCIVVGISGSGKSHLLNFLIRDDVQKKHLGAEAGKYFFLLIDLHDLIAVESKLTEWGVYELILRRLIERLEEIGAQPQFVGRWRRNYEKVVETGPSLVLAHSYFERAIHNICRLLNLRVVIIFDEFDEIFRTFEPWLFLHLLALRDRFHYRVSYILGTRDELHRLREDVSQLKSFIEIFSGNTCGLGRYDDASLDFTIRRLAKRIERSGNQLNDRKLSEIVEIAGGHPRLMRAALMAVRGTTDETSDLSHQKLLTDHSIQDECEEIWNGIQKDERQVLYNIATGYLSSQTPSEVRRILRLKGLLVEGGDEEQIFSDLFKEYVRRQSIHKTESILVDKNLGAVWVRGKKVEGLANLEFKLLEYLYENKGKVCTRLELLRALYPDEKIESPQDKSDYRVPSLINHLKKKIELNSKKPRLIITLRKRGYKLEMEDNEKNGKANGSSRQ